jgi:hypothetical protein
MPPPAAHSELVHAVELAIAGHRQAARAILDPLESDQTACWIRACLHKIEGDETNARYWYRRSRQFYESFPDARAELVAIKAALTY